MAIINYLKEELDNELDVNMKSVLTGIKKFDVLTHDIDGELYVTLFHGTSKKNFNKIMKTGKLFANTYFAADQETSKRYAQMTGGTPVVDTITIKADALSFNGYYFSSNREVKRYSGNLYK